MRPSKSGSSTHGVDLRRNETMRSLTKPDVRRPRLALCSRRLRGCSLGSAVGWLRRPPLSQRRGRAMGGAAGAGDVASCALSARLSSRPISRNSRAGSPERKTLTIASSAPGTDVEVGQVVCGEDLTSPQSTWRTAASVTFRPVLRRLLTWSAQLQLSPYGGGMQIFSWGAATRVPGRCQPGLLPGVQTRRFA